MLRISPRIQWHEGMFLGPQHFQQMEKRIDELLFGHTELLHNHHWGVFRLKFDLIALIDGVLQVSELKALMPDNTYVQYPEDIGPLALQINLKDYRKDAEMAPIKVYLCVPEQEEGRSTVIGEWPRYNSVTGLEVRDENMQDNMISIPRLLPKLSLIVGDTYPPRYTSFPVAEIGYRDEVFYLTDFQAPQLKIDFNNPLHERAIHICQRIREKALYLADKWERQVGTTLLNETANQLRPLLKVLPILESTLRGQAVHPQTLYYIMCVALGELSTMRLTVVPPPVPMYYHDNFCRVLEAVFNALEQLLESIEQSVLVLPFSQRERLFYLKLHDSFFSKQMYLGFKAPSSMTSDMLYEWAKDAVIACDSSVETARSKRIIGAVRDVLDHEEMSDFLTTRGTLVMKLPYPSEFLRPGENLNIFNASDDESKRPLSIVLYLKNFSSNMATAA